MTHTVRIDDETGILSNRHMGHRDIAGRLVDRDVRDPCGPCRGLAGEGSVDIDRVGKPAPAHHVAIGLWRLPDRTRRPPGTIRDAAHQIGRALHNDEAREICIVTFDIEGQDARDFCDATFRVRGFAAFALPRNQGDVRALVVTLLLRHRVFSLPSSVPRSWPEPSWRCAGQTQRPTPRCNRFLGRSV